jgi:leucyl-tRNA synthetase
MVLNHIYSRKGDKSGITYFAPEEVDVESDDTGRVLRVTAKADGQPVEYGGVGTMSKSKRNGVDPQSLIEEYGADTARFYMMFTAPPEQTLEWSDQGVDGASRFLKRVWSFAALRAPALGPAALAAPPADLSTAHKDIRREVHAVLKQANFDLARHQFNTVASAAMKMLNALEKTPAADTAGNVDAGHRYVMAEGASILLRVLSPITPHLCHHLWRELGYGEDILAAPWPEPDAQALDTDEIDLVVQVNGKLRGNIRVAKDADREAIETAALAEPNVAKFVDGKTPKKVVVVPGRLVNIVV